MIEECLPRHEYAGGTKILRVPEMFGPPNEVFPVSHAYEARDMDVITSLLGHGYKLVFGGTPDKSNPLELGIGFTDEWANLAVRNREIAQLAGVRMPKELSLKDILSLKHPVIAKRHDFHVGEYKFLLEDPVQIAKFLSFYILLKDMFDEAFVKVDLDTNHLSFTQGFLDKTHDTIQGILQKRLLAQSHVALENLQEFFTFQEYINSPSDRATSFRVLLSPYHIYYTAFIISPYNKTTLAPLVDPDRNTNHAGETIRSWGAKEFEMDYLFFTHTESPFCLFGTEFTSWRSDNSQFESTEIFLDGEPVYDPVYMNICRQHGINPDYPQAPTAVHKASLKIACALRVLYPAGGADFIMDTKRRAYLTEVNLHPAIISGAIGLPDEADYEEGYRHLLSLIGNYPDGQIL